MTTSDRDGPRLRHNRRRDFGWRWFRVVLACAAAVPVAAAVFHVDPAGGSMSNPGTSEAPWSTLEAVAGSGRSFGAGDVILLRSGYHGSATLRGINSGEVTVRPAEGARPTLKNLTVRAARNWRIRGLAISPEVAPVFERVTMVSVAADASEVVVEDCDLYTVKDAGGWTAADWDTRACNGISLSGPRNAARGNRLRNVNFGISVTGASNVVARNVVENFSGDGLRGLGDYCVFEYNVVKNCYDVNANHDDGFQSWSVGPQGVGSGVVRGVVLRGNRILNYEDPAQPHRGTLQGIGCFDGFFEDWVVENNEIRTDHWHGITLLGARNCRIVNNTVVDLNPEGPGPPWIQIGNHKDGTPSSGNVVRNNLATDLQVPAGAGAVDHNLEVTDYSLHFRNYDRGDLRLVPSSPAIDAGSTNLAPASDAAGLPRPLDGNGDGDAAIDLGAHELAHGSADADGDGLSDADEAVAGTSLWDAADRFEVQAAPIWPDRMRLSWTGKAGRLYSVATRPDVHAGGWNDVGAAGWTNLPGDGAVLAVTNRLETGPPAWFRVSVQAP